MESNFVDVAQIAKVCHEAVRAHEQTLGNKGTKSWEEIDQPARDATMQTVLVHLNNPTSTFGSRITHALFANIVRAFSGGRKPVLSFRAAPMMSIKAGEQNDPSVDIGSGEAVTQEFLDVMTALGFREVHGSFVYNADGRAIWVNPQASGPNENITRQIVEQGEAIGARRKINEIRQALDLPFEVIAVVEQPNEQAS